MAGRLRAALGRNQGRLESPRQRAALTTEDHHKLYAAQVDMKEKKPNSSFMPMAILFASAWILALSADIAFFFWTPQAVETFNEFDDELPALTLILIDLSRSPIYMPIIALFATIAMLCGLLLGRNRSRLGIILAVIALALTMSTIAVLFFSLAVPYINLS